MNLRHITRFTYKYTNFQGWRVAINRKGTTLARYFSDKQYGSEEEARDQAIRFRDMLVDELNKNPQYTREILDKYRVLPQNPYPAGLKPGSARADMEEENGEKKTAACSLRSNHVMQGILKSLCKRLQLDTASVLKLSLYMFVLQYNEQTAKAEEMMAGHAQLTNSTMSADYLNQPEARLQRLVSELNALATRAGFPSFEEFSTGKTRNHTTPADTCDTHNTSPPAQNPTAMTLHVHNTHHNPPRPSPPPHSVSNTPPAFFPLPLTRLSANPPLHATSLQKMILPIVTDSGHTAHNIEHKPKRIALGSAPTNLPPPDYSL